MTPKDAIQALITALNDDKTMAQPWKNYALSDARRLEALIEKGGSVTLRQPPDDMRVPKGTGDTSGMQTATSTASGCLCGPGKPNANCPIHGLPFPG